jgi:alkanesulfonate monooxygenase SsuD/methylene tetrahydromethanopterin reductase-like flavin-dependent oxidoreductase (luciferase family)
MFAALGSGLADWAFTLEQLVEAGSVLPSSWVEEGAAVGSESRCADRIEAYLTAGADEIMLHGNAPDQLATLVAEISSRASARTQA